MLEQLGIDRSDCKRPDPIALETTGVYGDSPVKIAKEIGRSLVEATRDQWDSFWFGRGWVWLCREVILSATLQQQ